MHGASQGHAGCICILQFNWVISWKLQTKTVHSHPPGDYDISCRNKKFPLLRIFYQAKKILSRCMGLASLNCRNKYYFTKKYTTRTHSFGSSKSMHRSIKFAWPNIEALKTSVYPKLQVCPTMHDMSQIFHLVIRIVRYWIHMQCLHRMHLASNIP